MSYNNIAGATRIQESGIRHEQMLDKCSVSRWQTANITSETFNRANKKPARSDLHRFLDRVSEYWLDEDIETLVYPIYGQTGIGKTTLLKQFIAAITASSQFQYDPTTTQIDITGEINPRQILYVPLEESLYHLEQPSRAFDYLASVIDYFQTHVATPEQQTFIVLDDLSTFRLNKTRKAELLQLIGEKSFLFLTGIVESQVDFRDQQKAAQIDRFQYPFPMLPMKFIDTVKRDVFQALFEDGLKPTSNLQQQILSHQSDREQGLIRQARKECL